MSDEEQAFRAYRSRPTQDLLLALLRGQQNRVYNLCFQVLRHDQDAEDAAQKVLLKLAEGIGALADAAAMRRWLYRVCVTTSLDARTQRSRRRAREREVALMSPSETAPEPQGAGEILTAIASLDADAGDLVVRHYFEKSTLKELAEERQVSEVAVWKKIEKAKARLREVLSTRGSALSMAALDGRLESIVPVSAPATWVPLGALAKAGGAGIAVGGITLAAKMGSTAKLVAVCIGILAVGLGAAIAIGAGRARRQALEAQEQATAAAVRLRRAEAESAANRARTAAAPSAAAAPVSVKPELPTPKAPTSPEAAADADIKERLRKLIQLTLRLKESKKRDISGDKEAMNVIMAVNVEFGSILQAPSSNPSKFATYTRLSLEVMFEELGSPLSDSQKTAIAAAVDRMRTLMEQVVKDPAQERSLGELRGYQELLTAMRQLTEDQLQKLVKGTDGPSSLFPPTGAEILVLNSAQDPAAEIAKEWSRKYQLGEPQKAAAGTAARTFVDSWDRVDRQYEVRYGVRPGDKPAGSPSTGFIDQATAATEYSISVLEAQRDALRVLEGALTPEQLKRLRDTCMSTIQRPVSGSAASGVYR